MQSQGQSLRLRMQSQGTIAYAITGAGCRQSWLEKIESWNSQTDIRKIGEKLNPPLFHPPVRIPEIALKVD